MTLRGEIDTRDLQRSLQRWQTETLPNAIADAVDQGMQAGLLAAIDATPVDTAQARAGWIAPLQELGGIPPAGWTGNEPSGAAIQSGLALGSMSRDQSESRYEITVENGVPYLVLLDQGTRNQPPRRIIVAALQAAHTTTLRALRTGWNS